ncbi:MAG: DUF305 domain-containing protein, partial [Rhodoferax sp.]
MTTSSVLTRTFATLAFTAAAALSSSPLWAQEKDLHAGHNMAAQGDTSPSSVAYEAANTKMHKDMAVTLTGDADRDFLAGMIPHHQGAIDMAEVVLKYGKDPKV